MVGHKKIASSTKFIIVPILIFSFKSKIKNWILNKKWSMKFKKKNKFVWSFQRIIFLKTFVFVFEQEQFCPYKSMDKFVKN